MKIKVDKDEWEELKKRVESIESSQSFVREYHLYLQKHLKALMEDFFNNKVHTYMVKRDREMIIAEMKSKAIDNIFKESQ